jgi:CRP-like cAMP-binding protein
MFNAHLIEELPSRMRADLVLHRFATIIDKVPFFHGVREDAVVDICAQLQSHSVMPNHNIITKGEPYRELVILTAGRARTEPVDSQVKESMTGQIDKSGLPVAKVSKRMKQLVQDICVEYTAGSFFGELEFLGFSEVIHQHTPTHANVFAIHRAVDPTGGGG